MSAALQITWREADQQLVPFVMDAAGREQQAAWCPQAGSQEAFITCPITEALYEGPRGNGKTDTLLMDFLQHVGVGYKHHWNGILFRRTFPELSDIIDKSLAWFPRIFPGAKYNISDHVWTFPDGEKLRFAFMDKEKDYWSHHGKSYTWIAWEELTTWADPGLFKKMFSCLRSPVKGIPLKVRATTNPYGVGHNWVKARYRLPLSRGRVVGRVIANARDRNGDLEVPRCSIRGRLEENKVLLFAQPDYITNIRTAARNKAELRAWEFGDWNIVAGGMFDDVWDPVIHVLPSFPLRVVPKLWKVQRSYDHGQSAPFSVGWWAISNGEPFEWEGTKIGVIRGDLIRIAEWYGWNGEPNEGVRMLSSDIAAGILERERDWGLGRRVRPGPADSSIYDDFEPGKSVAGDMSKKGVRWHKADKGPGSRKQGWEQMRKLFKAAVAPYRESPGMYVTERCEQFIRTVPVLPRDDKDLDDVDTDAEDHIGDEARYQSRHKDTSPSGGSWR